MSPSAAKLRTTAPKRKMKPWLWTLAMARVRTGAETSARLNVTIATRPAITSLSAGRKAAARKDKDRGGEKSQKKMQPRPRKSRKRRKRGQRWKRFPHLQKHPEPE